jgi:allantoate deiminase
MERLGMTVHVDAAGNLRGLYRGQSTDAPRLLIGSHLDTVPHAGPFDGILGVVLGIALIEQLAGRHLSYAIEILAFSEEEGVRFGTPFIGSRALVGCADDALLGTRDVHGISVAEAIRQFGLDPARIPQASLAYPAFGYLEFHIEQGPALESLNRPIAVVNAIAGQSRWTLEFTGQANHAGTTPMNMRRDALTCAAAWITSVETIAELTPSLVATVGRLHVEPGAGNVVPGRVTASLDVRHSSDWIRVEAVRAIIGAAREIASQRGLALRTAENLDQPAVVMDPALSNTLAQAVSAAGLPVEHLISGAGHDAMIVAERIPSAMLFLRSPGGISHHPDETVLLKDVAAALAVGKKFLEKCESLHA